jgi:hypothetical protein
MRKKVTHPPSHAPHLPSKKPSSISPRKGQKGRKENASQIARKKKERYDAVSVSVWE